MKSTLSRRILRTVGRIFAVLGVTLGILLISVYSLLLILTKGPSPTAAVLFVKTVKETSAGGFLADMFFSQEEIREIIAVRPSDVEASEHVDTSLIKIRPKVEETTAVGTDDPPPVTPDTGSEGTTAPEQPPVPQNEGIVFEEVTGNGYNGIMMIVEDPFRVFIGTLPGGYGEGKRGLTVGELCDAYGAVAGINAGGFYDPEGTGTGGIPEGFVIGGGELLWKDADRAYSVIGFDSNHILHVGSMTAQQALRLGMESAVCFGPALIINGEPCNKNWNLGGGVNPRTAIGQRGDGAVLLLVINGRQINSLGANYDDLIDIMLRYGAVNASNLDGGSSTLMMYKGEYKNNSAYLFGERIVPNAILVK